MNTHTIEAIKKTIYILKEKRIYLKINVVDGISSEPEINVEGKKVIQFCSGNYLGLANHPEVKKAVIEGINKYGLHPAGSQLVSGTLDIHKKLEKEISLFKNGEEAMVFTTGTMANMGVIPAIINIPNLSVYAVIKSFLKSKDAAIFSDELNHATVIDGCRLAKAKVYIYKHRDMNDLEDKLDSCRKKRKLVITDGVFSMDGDITPLPIIINLSKEYNATLMVDDAHGTGVLGIQGKGTLEHFGLNSGIDIQMGTFSKAFGVLGGFIVGEKLLIEYLRIFSRTYMFTGGFFGSLANGVLKSLEIVKNDKTRRAKLWENTDYLRNSLHRLGYNTLNSETPIIPILIGDEGKAIEISDELLDKGILAPSIRWPAVPKIKARIRFSLTAIHSKKQIDYLLNILENIKLKYKV